MKPILFPALLILATIPCQLLATSIAVWWGNLRVSWLPLKDSPLCLPFISLRTWETARRSLEAMFWAPVAGNLLLAPVAIVAGNHFLASPVGTWIGGGIVLCVALSLLPPLPMPALGMVRPSHWITARQLLRLDHDAIYGDFLQKLAQHIEERLRPEMGPEASFVLLKNPALGGRYFAGLLHGLANTPAGNQSRESMIHAVTTLNELVDAPELSPYDRTILWGDLIHFAFQDRSHLTEARQWLEALLASQVATADQRRQATAKVEYLATDSTVAMASALKDAKSDHERAELETNLAIAAKHESDPVKMAAHLSAAFPTKCETSLLAGLWLELAGMDPVLARDLALGAAPEFLRQLLPLELATKVRGKNRVYRLHSLDRDLSVTHVGIPSRSEAIDLQALDPLPTRPESARAPGALWRGLACLAAVPIPWFPVTFLDLQDLTTKGFAGPILLGFLAATVISFVLLLRAVSSIRNSLARKPLIQFLDATNRAEPLVELEDRAGEARINHFVALLSAAIVRSKGSAPEIRTGPTEPIQEAA